MPSETEIKKQIKEQKLEPEVLKYLLWSKKHEAMVPTKHLENLQCEELENIMKPYFSKEDVLTLKKEKRAGFSNALILIYFVLNFGLFFAFLFLTLA